MSKKPSARRTRRVFSSEFKVALAAPTSSGLFRPIKTLDNDRLHPGMDPELEQQSVESGATGRICGFHRGRVCFSHHVVEAKATRKRAVLSHTTLKKRLLRFRRILYWIRSGLAGGCGGVQVFGSDRMNTTPTTATAAAAGWSLFCGVAAMSNGSSPAPVGIRFPRHTVGRVVHGKQPGRCRALQHDAGIAAAQPDMVNIDAFFGPWAGFAKRVRNEGLYGLWQSLWQLGRAGSLGGQYGSEVIAR